jgi:hypothetical protein|tara:strand:+ start:560 stop:1543 length:984 start_codon:yes stop_codon:yes gene_type:complete
LNEEYYISLIGEAFDGYSETTLNDKTAYIKHVSIKDQRYLHKYYERYKTLATQKGLETSEERLTRVKNDGMWSSEDDGKISSLEFELKNLRVTQKNLPLPSQRQKLGEEIKEKEQDLISLKSKRKEIIGKTADDYAMSRSGDEILRFLIFKDQDLTDHFYGATEFDELEVWEVLKINKLQLEVSERLSDKKIQEAVLRPFFGLYLSLFDDVAGFYGKPVVNLSHYQLRVAYFSKVFYNIFQNVEDIPDDYKQDPEKLLAFADASRDPNKSKALVKDDADGSVVFGATDQDVKHLKGKKGDTKLSDELKKHGGKLDMQQMMRLAGHDV